MPSNYSIKIALAEARYMESQQTSVAVKSFLESCYKSKRSRQRLMNSLLLRRLKILYLCM
jgi:hypothetical protein